MADATEDKMKGGIRQRGSGWQAKVDAGRGADGKKQYVARTFRTRQVCGLRWQDVDLDAGRLTVRQELIVVEGKRVFKEPRTASSKAAVPLLQEVAVERWNWQTIQNVEKVTAGPLWEEHGGGLVFCQVNGRPLHPNTLRKRDFKRILARGGLPTDMRTHDLRHTVRAAIVASGADPKTAQALLRHADVGTTLARYTHLQSGMAERAIQHLRALLPDGTGSVGRGGS